MPPLRPHAHGSAYVQKPRRIDGFTKVVDAIEQFWFEIVLLHSDDR